MLFRCWLALHIVADWSTGTDLYWGTTAIGNYSPGVASHWGTEPWGTVGLERSFRIEAVGDDDYFLFDGFESGDTSIWTLTIP